MNIDNEPNSGTPENPNERNLTRPKRRDLVTFTDEPQAKPVSARRKKTRLAKGGMFFGERDRLIIEFVAAHGWLDIEQISRFIGNVSVDALRQSIRRLVEHQLLDDRCSGFRNQSLYTATAFGLRKANLQGFNSNVTPRMQSIEHSDAITALHLHFISETRNSPNASYLTEREMNAALASGVMPPRILRRSPWSAQYTNFDAWVPNTVTSKGKATTKRPDGLFLNVKDGLAQPPIPVEVERNLKSRKDYYQQALLLFAAAAQAGGLSSTVFFYSPSHDRTLHNLRKAIDDVLGSKNGFIWPRNLPQVNCQIDDLDTFFTPFSVSHNWLPRRTG